MHTVVDPETGQVFSLDYAKAHLVRDRLQANKPAMKSGMDQRSFCNPETRKCIYRENHTDSRNVFASGDVRDDAGKPLKKIDGVRHVNPAVVKAGDGVEIEALVE